MIKINLISKKTLESYIKNFHIFQNQTKNLIKIWVYYKRKFFVPTLSGDKEIKF